MSESKIELIETIVENSLDEVKFEESSTFKKIKVNGDRAELIKALTRAVGVISKWNNIDPSRLKNQIKVCLNLIDGILKGKRNFVVTADTGFGKSIFGLMASEMLRQASHEGSIKGGDNAYILTPNLFLQDQYQGDIDKFNLGMSHAQLKGQSNYKCDSVYLNPSGDLTFATRPCSGVTIKGLESSSKYTCSSTCSYILSRNNAIHSQTTVLNYNYFLTTMNNVFSKNGDESPFRPRVLTVFDECHTIAPIVQDMFSSEFDFCRNAKDIESVFLKVNSTYGQINLMEEGLYNSYDKKDVSETIEFLKSQQKKLKNLTSAHNGKLTHPESAENIINELSNVVKYLNPIIKIYSKIITVDDSNFPKHESGDVKVDLLTMESKDIYENAIKVNELNSEILDLVQMFRDIGLDSLVVDTKETKYWTKNNEGEKATEEKSIVVTFRCVRFDQLIKKYVTKFTDISIFMSATIGDTADSIGQFAKNHGIEDPYIIINRSDFDFSKSPIVIATPPVRMSYNEKEANMPKMLEMIKKIVFSNGNKAGLIHTGNYAFMNILQTYAEANGIDDRFIWCRTAKQKRLAVKQLKWDIEKTGGTNRILVGASLLEGVDLKDDMCRFTIFMKVPYASLADQLVKKMMETYDGWYSWITMQQVVQGIGRSNRHKNDWSTVFLLDGSFMGFFKRYGDIPRIISNRLRYANIDSWFGSDMIHEHTPVVVSPKMPVEKLNNEARKTKELADAKAANAIFGGADIGGDEYEEMKNALL